MMIPMTTTPRSPSSPAAIADWKRASAAAFRVLAKEMPKPKAMDQAQAIGTIAERIAAGAYDKSMFRKIGPAQIAALRAVGIR